MKTCVKSVSWKSCIWRVPHTLRSKAQVKAFSYFFARVTKPSKNLGFYICKVKELLIHSCRMAVSRICHQLLINSRNLGIHVSSCTCELLWTQRRGQTSYYRKHHKYMKMRGGTQLEEPIRTSARKFTSNFCHLGKSFSDSSAAFGTIFYPFWAMSSSGDFDHFLLNHSHFLSSPHRITAVYCRFKDYTGNSRCWSTQTHTPSYSILHEGHMLHSCFNLCCFYFQFLSKCFSHFSYELFLEVQTSLFSCIMLPTYKLTLGLKHWLIQRGSVWKILKSNSLPHLLLSSPYLSILIIVLYSIILNYRIQNNYWFLGPILSG